VGQRHYRCHARKRRKLHVDLAKFIAVALEIGPEESVGLAIEGFYILKASSARKLLCKDALISRCFSKIGSAPSVRRRGLELRKCTGQPRRRWMKKTGDLL
jgi:hypothetical protein